ncbi:MAG: permease [Candidatus Aminicenantes bacterium RBG_13_62_12]|nr:MAG: permease [Candidatus Aminicenantes bacterium RBG_13_62_12]
MKADRALIEIHLAVLLFGLAGLFGKWLALAPVLIVFGRVTFAGAALAAALGALRRPLFARRFKDQTLFALLGILLAVHWVCFFRSIQVSTVAVGLLSYSTFPLFTAFLEPLLLRERMERRAVLLSLVCLAGVALIIPRFALSDSVLRGTLWGLAAGASFSVLTILNRRMRRDHSSPSIAFQQDFFAALALLPVVCAAPRAAISPRDILLLAALGLVCTAGAHTLFIEGMKSTSARTASLISSLEPVYGIVLAFFFLGEIPSARTLLGGVLILSAVLAVTLSGIKPASSSGRL